MTYRILITGSRDWTDVETIRQAMIAAGRAARVHPQEAVIVHGDARGADAIADQLARGFGCQVEKHPADWATYGRSAGHRRNAEMVNAGADVCLAFPLGESRGTRGCMAMASAAGITVYSYNAYPAVAS